MRAVVCGLLLCAVGARAADAPSSITTTTTTSAPSTTTPTTAPTEVVLEEQAFAAIDDKQWCLAMRLFERAHELGPAAGLLHNAARAAELGGDLDGAVRWHEAIKTFAGSTKAQRSAAIKKTAELKKQIASTGAGTACATLEVLQPPPAPVVVEEAPVVEAAPVVVVTDQRPTGYVVAGVGGAAVVAGGVVTGIGLLSWFAHADALQRVLAAEKDKGDASAAQADQEAARAAWEGQGRLLTVVGSAVAGAGVIALVGGLGFALTRPVVEEEAP